jgi:Tfp pilus assembly protein PilN
MRKMHIDFSAPSVRRSLYRTPPLAWVALLAAAALCAGAAYTGYHTMAELRAADARIARAQQARQPAAQVRAQATKAVIPEAQAKAVNAAILQLNLPWRELQQTVAESTPKSIGLLALEPDPRKQALKITAEAKSADDMIAYIEELKEQEFFAAAVLTRHEVMESDPNRPLRFQVEVQWGAR